MFKTIIVFLIYLKCCKSIKESCILCYNLMPCREAIEFQISLDKCLFKFKLCNILT
jgi:hypothetical protein